MVRLIVPDDISSLLDTDPELGLPCQSHKIKCSNEAAWRLRNLCCGVTTLLCDPCKLYNDEFARKCENAPPEWLVWCNECGASVPVREYYKLETLEHL